MMDRNAMDGPAMGVALFLGITLIGAGVAGIVVFDAPLATYTIDWVAGDVPAAVAETTLEDAPGEAEAAAAVEDTFVAQASVFVTACSDERSQLDQEATLTWTLTEERQVDGDTQVRNLDSQSFTCAEAPEDGWTISVENPQNTPIEAASLDSAVAQAGALDVGFDARYVLIVSAAREAGVSPVPIPGQEPALTAEFAMHIIPWDFNVREDVEVLR